MKKLAFFLFLMSFFLALALSAYGAEDYEYQGYTPLPSEQAYAEIQQMSGLNLEYDRELRDKPGGGPGLGEIQVPMNSTAANILVLAFMGGISSFRRAIRKKRV